LTDSFLNSLIYSFSLFNCFSGGLGCDIIIVTMRTFRDVWYLAALSFIIAQTGVTGLISEGEHLAKYF